MDMKGDKHGYLRKTGAIPQQRCAVSTKAIAVSGSTRGKGSLGSTPESKTNMGKTAKIEGNETARYEKLEKRSLKSMKQGGSEKELRRGHNDGGQMSATDSGYKPPKSALKHASKMKKPAVPAAKPQYNFNTNPIKAAKQENRAAMQTAKATGDKSAVKLARAGAKDELRVAKGVRQARNAMGLRKADRAAGKAARMEARKTTAMRRKNTGLAGLV